MEYLLSTPLPVVTLEEAKRHLRIEFEDEDALIQTYILTATSQAEAYLEREIIKRVDEQAISLNMEDVPYTIKLYVLTAVGDFYAHRELSTDKAVNMRYKHLLDAYVLYNRDIEHKAVPI